MPKRVVYTTENSTAGMFVKELFGPAQVFSLFLFFYSCCFFFTTKVGDNFFGLSPLPKMRERIAIKEYASLQEGAKKIQGCFRQEDAIGDIAW